MKKIKSFCRKHSWETIMVSLSVIIIGLTLLSYSLNDSFWLNESYDLNTEKLGQFGDFIGGFLGTVLTILATVYIYKTFQEQKKSLTIQEKQLNSQNEELESQKEELFLNRQLIAQQQFESTFFNMLNVHRELKKGLELNIIKKICNVNPQRVYIEPYGIGGSQSLISRIADFDGVNVFYFIRLDFEILYKDFKSLNTTNGSQNFGIRIIKNEIKDQLLQSRELLNGEENQIINKIFRIIFFNYRNILSHYFRNIYHVLKYIRQNQESELLGKNKEIYQKYADIFQSQLNEDEQFLLFYNCIYFEDDKKEEYSTMSLINHYKFLENLGHENLLDNELHNKRKFYKEFEVK